MTIKVQLFLLITSEFEIYRWMQVMAFQEILSPREEVSEMIMKLTNVLLFMSLLHGMEQNWIKV